MCPGSIPVASSFSWKTSLGRFRDSRSLFIVSGTKGKKFRGVLVDRLETESTIKNQELYSKSKNNCFVGTSLPGNIHQVILGESVYSLSK